MNAKDAASIPLPPSPLLSPANLSPPSTSTSTGTKHLPVMAALPGGLPVSLSFTAFGSRYTMDTVFSEGAKIASQIAALVQRHAIPAHIGPQLDDEAVQAVRTAYGEIGSSDSSPILAMPPPPDFDFADRIDHLVALYSAANSSVASQPFDAGLSAVTAEDASATDAAVAANAADTADLEEAFSLAYRRVIHAPISGLLDAVLGLQVRYAAALQQLSGKRNADLVRLAQMHEKERRTDPGLAATHESERREALAMWQAQMADMAEEQRDEFRFFIQAIAHVLAHHPEDQPPLDYQALMHQVFDMDRDVPPLVAPAALPAGSPTTAAEDGGFVRGRASSFNGSPSVGLQDGRRDGDASGGAQSPPAGRRTLRKSASTQLLRLTNLHSDTDSSDDDEDKAAAKDSSTAHATDTSTPLESPPLSPTLTVSPFAPAPTLGDSLSSQNDLLAARIMEMGFSSDEAHAALLMADSQVEQALSLLLENPASVTDFIKQQKAERERIATAKASKSSVQRKLTERLASQLPTLSSGANVETAGGGSNSNNSRTQPVPASSRRKVSTPDPAAAGASTNSTSPSWSPLRFLQTEVGGAVQGKLSGWFSGTGATASAGPGGAARSTSPPGRSSSIHSLPGSTHPPQTASSSTAAANSMGHGHGHGNPHPTPAGLLAPPTVSPTSLTTESFSVYLGTQLKVTYVVTLVRVPPVSMGGGLASYLVPPTPPAGVSKQSDPGAWGEAVAVRSRMAIDLYRALHVLVVPYPARTTPRAVVNRSVVAQVATGMVPELVFEDVKKQVKHAAAMAGVEYGSGANDTSRTRSAAAGAATDDGWVDVDTASTDAMGTVLFTRHSNLASCNAIAHVFPASPSSAGDAAASAPSPQADMNLLKALISQLRPSDPVEFSLPVSFSPDTLVDTAPPSPSAELAGSSLSRRVETVIKGVRGSLLDRARVRVFGAPDPERQGSGMSNRSVSALGVPTEGDGTLDGGSVALLCMSDDEWRIAHRVVASVFKTG